MSWNHQSTEAATKSLEFGDKPASAPLDWQKHTYLRNDPHADWMPVRPSAESTTQRTSLSTNERRQMCGDKNHNNFEIEK